MKHLKKAAFLAVAFALIGLSVNAQKGSSFGIKAGLNYGSNGDIEYAISNTSQNPDSNIGYHAGLFGKLRITRSLYVRPELVYTKITSEYNITDGRNTDNFDMQKLDVPLLLGIDIIGPVSIFGGPSFQYILDTDVDDVTLSDVESDLTVGLNFGVAVSLGKLGIDLRYERGFSDNEIDVLQNNNITFGTIDTRPEQLILSLSLAL